MLKGVERGVYRDRGRDEIEVRKDREFFVIFLVGSSNQLEF